MANAQARRFRFNNQDQASEFIEKYGTMFVSYADSVTNQKKQVTRAFGGSNNGEHYEEGYTRSTGTSGYIWITANLTAKDFKSIIATGEYRRERLCPGVLMNVYIDEEESQ